MRDWLVGFVPEGYADAVLWTAAALVLLVLFLAIFRYARGFGAGTFVAGGRNRRTRLAVMDATAVDARRRLVLVRRDDVEHLILIGGPTDVVVEQDIRVSMRPPRSIAREELDAEPSGAPAAEPVQVRAGQQQPAQIRGAPTLQAVRPAPVPAVPAPATRAAQATSPGYVRTGTEMPAGSRPPPPVSLPRTEIAPPRRTVAPPVAVRPPAKPDPVSSLDDDLVHELEASLDEVSSPRTSASLEDEMNKLLGELSSGRR